VNGSSDSTSAAEESPVKAHLPGGHGKAQAFALAGPAAGGESSGGESPGGESPGGSAKKRKLQEAQRNFLAGMVPARKLKAAFKGARGRADGGALAGGKVLGRRPPAAGMPESS
jgi:hypothetical protein